MTGLAGLHGGGYRLVLEPPDNEFDRSIRADLFGPDGKIESGDDPIVLGFDPVDTAEGRRVLRIDPATAERIGRLLSKAIPSLSPEVTPREVFATTPLRVYQRLSLAAEVQDGDVLDRLGRLGDALLVDYDAAPPPPLPGDMACMPAAFTYLGQFLAHEMTVWNPTGSEEPPVTPEPIDSAIDLKTIFLLPPDFPKKLPIHVQEQQGLPLGSTIADLGTRYPGAGLDDVPRRADGNALLFERRNDQNLAVSQTHVAITRFAQAALRLLNAKGPGDLAARRIVIRHFQSVVLQDYLPRLVDEETLDNVMTQGRAWVAPPSKPHALDPFYVAPEFSGAIFRFGHAMVRDVYQPWNTVDPDDKVPFAFASDLLQFSYAGGSLTNGQLTQKWTTDWRHMLGSPGIPAIHARQLGTGLSKELFCLPGYLFQPSALDRSCSVDDPRRINLARRTLMGCALLLLPSGQSLAQQVNAVLPASATQIPVLAPDDLNIPRNQRATDIMLEGQVGQRFVDQTPLWLYVLRESAVLAQGNRLGPLAGRIVAETLNAAIEASGTGMILKGKRLPFDCDQRLQPSHAHRYSYHDLVRLAFAE